MKKTLKIGFIIKRLNSEVLTFFEQLDAVTDSFKESGHRVEYLFERNLVRSLKAQTFFKRLKAKSSDFEGIVRRSHLIVSIGGDGTILKVARSLLESSSWKTVPILGVNAGRLGFLASIPLQEAARELEFFVSKRSRVRSEKRSCLEIRILRKGKALGTFYSLNDCVLKTSELSRLLEFQVDIDQDFLSSYRADGLIVASPTGSTAYSLAAGGSILEPSVSALLLTPICAQSFTNRPILIGDQHEIQIRVMDRDLKNLLTLDGQRAIEITGDDEINVRKSSRTITFVLPRDSTSHHYFHSLRQKLKWGLESPPST